MHDTVVLDGDISLLIEGSAEVGVITEIHDRYPDYTGETVITPSTETQVLPTERTSVMTDIIINPINVEPYEGEYVVTPKAYEEQTLETANKLMSENVSVLRVPYFETSNISGTTVYIANEV